MPSHHHISGSLGGKCKATWAPHCLHCLQGFGAGRLCSQMLEPSHCFHLLLSKLAEVLADARATALLALPSNAVVPADARATALLALPSNAARFSIRNKITDLKIIMLFFW
jgi:hypothetical protein